MLDESLTALVAESYSRAYFPLVMVQQCSELEEIIEYKRLLQEINTLGRSSDLGQAVRSRSDLSNEDTETDVSSANQMLLIEAKQKKTSLSIKWRKRIRGCRSTGRAAIPVWKSLLSVRRLVLSEREDIDTWLEFASLCGQGGNYKLAERILNISPDGRARTGSTGVAMLVESGGDVSELSMERRIQFARLQQQWSSSHQRYDAIKGLEKLLKSLGSTAEASYNDTDLHRDCLLKLGRWKLMAVEVGVPVDPATRREVLELYGQATAVDPSSYKAWHEVDGLNILILSNVVWCSGDYPTIER